MKGFILWNYTRLPDILFIIILLCIFALSVFLIRKIHKKKIYVITILIFVFTVVFWGYFHRNYGIKEISYLFIQGDNTITDSEIPDKRMEKQRYWKLHIIMTKR